MGFVFKAVIFALIVFGHLGYVATLRVYLPSMEVPAKRLYLRTNEVLQSLPNKPSYRYMFMDEHLHTPDGPNVRIFGVQSGDSVHLHLHNSSEDSDTLSISLSEDFCSASYGGESLTFNCDVNLNRDKMTWFVLETMKSYIAVYESGAETPVLDFSTKHLGISVNFNKFDSYSVASEQEAVWDFQGHLLDRSSLPEIQANPFLEMALERVEESLFLMKKLEWKCKEAKAQRGQSHSMTMKKKYVIFFDRHCYQSVFQPYQDSSVRHEAILLLNGKELPKEESYDVKEFFKHQY